MVVVYVLWKRMSLLAVGAKSKDSVEMASLLMFPLQLFDDLFTNMIFLDVETFTVLFFSMIALLVIRDIVRDCGIGYKILYWCTCLKSGTNGIDDEAHQVLFQYHLAEQNLMSELVSVLIIPFIVALDILLSAVGFGVDTLTISIPTEKKWKLLQTYAVLIGVECLTHIIVRYIIKQQLSAFSSRARANPVRVNGLQHRRVTVARRLSIFGQQWNAHKHERKFWDRHRFYFAIMISFSVVWAYFTATILKHSDPSLRIDN